MFMVCHGSHEAIYCLTGFCLIKNGFAMLLTGRTGPSKKELRRIRGLSGRAVVGKAAEACPGGSQAVFTVTWHQWKRTSALAGDD